TLSRIQFDFAPADQPLWRLPGAFRQRGINLGNLRSSSGAGVRHPETHLNTLSRSNFEIGIVVSGVRQTVAEGKQNRLSLSVVPLVSNLQPLVISYLEWRQAFRNCFPGIGLAIRSGRLG